MFKPGDRIICINNIHNSALKKYKEYIVKKSNDDYLTIYESPYDALSHDRFISLKEYRKLKLNKILNDECN